MNIHRSLVAALIGLAITSISSAAFAAATDYEFQPVKADVKNGAGSQLAVRLVHKPTGKPVEGAVLFRTRLDMSPDSMDEMTAKHSGLSTAEPGVYNVAGG